MSKDHNYVGISATVGGIGGAAYGFRHPSEKSCIKMSQMKPTAVETMKEYRDSFDIKQAGEALRDKKITEHEYKKVNEIRTAIHNTFEKEQQIIDIANTPLEERSKTYRQAVKEANATRPKLWKAILELKADFRDKLIDLKIFDSEKFTAATNSAKSKLAPLYKELSKGALKGLAIGIGAGAAIGVALNKITGNKS